MSNLTGQYDYDVAQKVLNDNDKNRFLCCYLNIKDTTVVDWDKAAKDFGSASVESFKKTISNAFKKIKTAQENGVPADAEGSATKATPKKGGKGKRKGADEEATEGESPTKKTKAKKSAELVEEADDLEEEVKKEEGAEDDLA
ncbi:hypothetical protein EJ03DRAFT_168045 [Teratosphaeria nubilosa]|uniref:Uncharacterized protein n=1 Tax=Teratosphaeria nubilosa TaxID=161662 RepID=A0A6G1L1G9_9PEZI|nr:hypothetical protein EJ03DRAFT_168045 [Teratosphaeria nubilosa]